MPKIEAPKRIVYKDPKQNIENLVAWAVSTGSLDNVMEADRELTEFYRGTCHGDEEDLSVLLFVNETRDHLEDKMEEITETEVRNWGSMKKGEWSRYCRERRLATLEFIGMGPKGAARFMKKMSRDQLRNLDYIWTRMAIPKVREE